MPRTPEAMDVPRHPISRFRPSLAASDFAAAADGLAHPGAAAEWVAQFEREFARMLGVAEVVTTPSARSALRLVLRHAGVEPESEVIGAAYTYWSMPAAVVQAGCRPVFVDVEPHTYLIDPSKIEAAITPRTRAIVATHLYGLPCDMAAIGEIARRRGLLLVEDCAQSTGARYRGRRTGSLADAAVFTFGVTKNFTTLFGGAIATNRPELGKAVRAEFRGRRTPATAVLREAVMAAAMATVTQPTVFAATLYPAMRLLMRRGRDFVHELGDEAPVATDSRVAERGLSQWHAAQAAVGMSQLGRLDANNAGRMRAGRYLREALEGTPGVQLPAVPADGREHVFMSFVIRSRERDRLRRALLARGVDTAAGYMHNCAAMDIFQAFAADCPVAEAVDREQVHLPVYPSLTDAELAYIAQCVRAA